MVENTKMIIGVSGASGSLGKAIIRELQERAPEHTVVAITRTPEDTDGAVETRHGDYDRPDTLAAAYKGLDRLVVIPSADPRPGQRTKQFLTAFTVAQSAGVKHVLMISGAGVRKVAEPHLVAPYWEGEQHLIKSGLDWTILRMNAYSETFAAAAKAATASGILPALAANRIGLVTRDDVAAAAAGVLIGEDHAGAIYNATAPEAVSGEQRAALITELTGKEVRFLPMAEQQLRGALLSMGMAEPMVNFMLAMQAEQAAGNLDIVTGDVAKLAGRPPRSLKEVLTPLLTNASAG